MKFLLRVGGDMCLPIGLRLEEEGHEVLVCQHDKAKEYRRVGDGLISKTRDFPAAVRWADVVVYGGNSPSPEMSTEAEQLRKTKPVVGCSAFGDKLEHDRDFAIKLVEKAGIAVPEHTRFSGTGAFDKARQFMEKQDESGWVLKPDTDMLRTFITYSVEEMVRMLDYAEKRFETEKIPPAFVIERRHDGVVVETEGWFTGTEWCLPNGTLEKQRLMDHDLGELTGCAGNLVWLYRGLDAPLFKTFLEPLTEVLRDKYRGPVCVNSVIDADTHERLFLEFTARLGYSAIFALTELVQDFGGLLASMANGRVYDGPILLDQFALGLRAHIPPYPSIQKDVANDYPIIGYDPEHRDSGVHPEEVRLDEHGLPETTGPDGIVFDFTASAPTIEECRRKLYEKIQKIHVPDIRYRTDIGLDAEKDFGRLEQLGLVERPQKPFFMSKRKEPGGL